MSRRSPPPLARLVAQRFEPAAARTFQVDRHYLLYATGGTLRLEADDQTWSLPPSRAALLTAGKPIVVTLPRPVTACSVLFDPGRVPPPPSALTVFEMSPLARELIATCRDLAHDGHDDDAAYLDQLLAALAAVTWRLARTPSSTSMPRGDSPALRQALALTEARLEDLPSFEEIATTVGLSPRTLARRFAGELGMTWRQAVRRLRVIQAIGALADTDDAITEIAMQVGYQSLSAFNAAFREHTGCTPTDYRRTVRD